MRKEFSKVPDKIVKSKNRNIYCFDLNDEISNIDRAVVDDFGEEWEKFSDFDENEIELNGKMYFDILSDTIINKNSYVLDVGCGTGRWSKYLAPKVGFIEAVDPSKAIFVADRMLADIDNVRLSMASTDTIPFEDNTFDFVMSIGVLHHIPNVQKALNDCVKKVKLDGYFYLYLYYNFENKSSIFKTIFFLVDLARKIISALPSYLKKLVCDIIAIVIYLPVIVIGRLIRKIGFVSFADKLPLSFYHNQNFRIIRNDALDRFGTRLEQRFSRDQIKQMMENAGLTDIIISDGLPYWHALGKKTNKKR